MYNPNDNWLYAISQQRPDKNPCYPGGYLLQIAPDTGQVYNLGPVVKPGTSDTAFETEGDRNVINSGVWTNAGYFIGNTSLSGTRKLYHVDLDSVSATVPFGNKVSYSEDWAVLPSAPEYMWGFQSKSVAKDKPILERIDTRTGESKTWDLSGSVTADGRTITFSSQSWGKAWTYSNGNLGFGAGSSGAGQNGFEIRITNPSADQPEVELINIMENLPASFNTDAASSILPAPEEFRSNLAVRKTMTSTKKVDGVARTYWTITVENTGEFPSSGGTFKEYLPLETHYGINSVGPTATFEGFGEGSTRVNGKMPGTDQTGDGSGILAGMSSAHTNGTEAEMMTGYVGTMPAGTKVEFIVSSPVRGAYAQGMKAVCSPNRVRLSSTDAEPANGEADNVATDVCFSKEAIDTVPRPTGNDNEYVVDYNVVVRHPGIKDFDTNAAVYGQLIDSPKFTGAASISGAVVTFTDEFGETVEKAVQGAGPYELNAEESLKFIEPQGVQKGEKISTGKHVYKVRVTFTLDAKKIDDTSRPENYQGEESGNYRCYEQGGLYEPNFGLMNEAELGGWKDTACVPITPPDKKMTVFLEKVAYDPDAPGQMVKDGLLDGAEFTVYSSTVDGHIDMNAPIAVSKTDTVGRMELRDLAAPGTYFLVETVAPNGYSLLPQPVKFSLDWTEEGSAKVAVIAGNGLAVSGHECERTDVQECNPKVGVLQIADVRTGELPKTGGSGLTPIMLAAAALIGAAFVTRRKLTA